MRRRLALTVFAAALALPATAGADHSPVPPLLSPVPAGTAFNSSPAGAWELVTSIPTGNPHTDLDFFTRDGETYASVGVLAAGPNGGGQTIVKLTRDGQVSASSVRVVDSHPSAMCPSSPASATGLQHDVEATPKGGAILNTPNPFAVQRDAQLLIDATDAPGRCHDQGVLGVSGAPRGGLELIDITTVSDPREIGLTSHIGESHTVNIDPKRPHIAYSSTSDSVTIRTENGQRVRSNDNPRDNDNSFALDGFEVVDLRSCMNFPAGTTVAQKRAACRPVVYRYRYPTIDMALGTRNLGSVFGCHELEVYPNDRLSCGSGNALMLFDMKGAFNDMGTPTDFSDDTPRGTPLPCRVRPSSTVGPTATAAMVTDCVVGQNNVDLRVANWRTLNNGNPPSLEGVVHLGSAHHQGREPTASSATPDFPSTEDIDFDHEAELTQSGNFLIASDERGGGVVPPGATCSPTVDNPIGNGGLHAYAVSRLDTVRPATAEEAFDAYARDPSGRKAVFRTPPNLFQGPSLSICTAHVFQIVPGQNRIFMGWYSQGTQVVDFFEGPNGTFEFRQAGFFIPERADQWVSHVFKVVPNPNGTFTYFGVAGDFGQRNAIDVYKVTLGAPPQAGTLAPIIPETPFTAILPIAAVGLFGAALLVRRLRTRGAVTA